MNSSMRAKRKEHSINVQYIVVPIIRIFMINLNRKSTIKKNRIDQKIGQKRSINLKVWIAQFRSWDLSVHVWWKPAKKKSKNRLQKNKKIIIYNRKSMIGLKNQFMKTDQSIMIENRFLIRITSSTHTAHYICTKLNLWKILYPIFVPSV